MSEMPRAAQNISVCMYSTEIEVDDTLYVFTLPHDKNQSFRSVIASEYETPEAENACKSGQSR